MLFYPHIIKEIVRCALWADRLVRADLIDNLIVSENDYTSNFTSAFRREVNSRAIAGLSARIQVLNPRAERALGADACVILENSTHFKAGIFEAKWPRLKTRVNAWDSLQTASKQSHFHTQLLKQRQQSRFLAIWEMFYCEFAFSSQPKFMPDYGSACVWHDDAYSYSAARSSNNAPWTDNELTSLLKAWPLTIGDVIEAMCMCAQGKKLALGEYEKVFGDAGMPFSALIITFAPDKQ